VKDLVVKGKSMHDPAVLLELLAVVSQHDEQRVLQQGKGAMLSIRAAAASLSALSTKRIPMRGEANARARMSADRGADSPGGMVEAI
jgi:hypothetical protein